LNEVAQGYSSSEGVKPLLVRTKESGRQEQIKNK